MTDDEDMRDASRDMQRIVRQIEAERDAARLAVIMRLESERDEAIARAEAAEACAKESAEIMYQQRNRLEGQRNVAIARAKEAERLLSAALARAAEAERLLAEYRRENGCTRGQRTTQWCGEAVRLREALKEIVKFKPTRATMGAWIEINRLREIAKAALKGDG